MGGGKSRAICVRAVILIIESGFKPFVRQLHALLPISSSSGSIGNVNKAHKEKIVVAMSGGVDSSTAAAMLARQRHEVIGVFLRLPVFMPKESGNRSESAAEDAARIAAELGVPFQVLDCTEIFEEKVIDHLCAAYLDGITPNPCVECNRSIKLGVLLDKAIELGADRLATGHYARIHRDPGTGRHLLKKGADPDKDQSYFLYSLSQRQLGRALFPLGAMTKKEVRATSQSFGLDFSETPESRDICFLAGGDYRNFLASRHPDLLKEGPIVDTDGRTLGRHKGIALHTIGQRKGLGIAHGEPLFVLGIDVGTSTIIAGSREKLFKTKLSLGRVNWIPFERPAAPLKVNARIRYRQTDAPAVVTDAGLERAEIDFTKPQWAAAPGQSAVLYDGDTVVGGGIIEGGGRSL